MTGESCSSQASATWERVASWACATSLSAEAEAVLHRDDRGDGLRVLQLLDRDLGQADVADLALVAQGGELGDLVLERVGLVDAVQLEQVDALHAEAAQRELGLLAQVRRV